MTPALSQSNRCRDKLRMMAVLMALSFPVLGHAQAAGDKVDPFPDGLYPTLSGALFRNYIYLTRGDNPKMNQRFAEEAASYAFCYWYQTHVAEVAERSFTVESELRVLLGIDHKSEDQLFFAATEDPLLWGEIGLKYWDAEWLQIESVDEYEASVTEFRGFLEGLGGREANP